MSSLSYINYATDSYNVIYNKTTLWYKKKLQLSRQHDFKMFTFSFSLSYKQNSNN